jgi:endogenous inhibitor of DNA gyrase (YacG/DUF329 family)
MNKCKNTECDNDLSDKRVYCSLKCRNVYVNKNIRDYKKCSETLKRKKLDRENEYLKDPKICIACESIISYDKRENKYCNSSCAAKVTNLKRTVTWSENIRNGVHKYLIESGIKEDGKIGIYDLSCKGCGKEFEYNRSTRKFCSEECKKEYKRKDMEEYQRYKSDCVFKFNLSDYVDEFDFSLVEKYGWYSPTNKNDNLGGISRDHMFSIREGFEKGIDSKIISHPANCKLMIHTENISKNKKSSITIEDLLNRIDKFNKKYKNKIIMEDLGAIS